MKNLKITARMLIVSVFIFFSACNKDDSSLSSDASTSEFDTPEYMVTDLSVIENPEVSAPSETSEMAMETEEANESKPPCMRKMDKVACKNEKSCCDEGKKTRHGKMHDANKCKNGKCDRKQEMKQNPRGLPFILKQLNLNERQKTAIKGFVAQHCDCVSEHHQKVHAIHHEMVKKANARRNELMAAYKAGRISKTDLHQKLEELRGRVKAEMQNHADKHKQMRIMRGCREELNSRIESVLNAEQLQKWNRWKASHK